MRTKKAGRNFIVGFITVLIGLIPTLIVRQVFLETLGTELLGLSSLYMSIIGLFALAELGISSAIIYALYKPFADENHEKVRAYINFYTRFYRGIGLTIFLIGLALLPFLNVFVQDEINPLDAQLYFLLFLANSILSYFFSAKLSILIVAQDGYKLTIAMAISKLVAAFLQVLLLNIYASFYYFLIIQVIIGIIYLIIMNQYVRNRYGWLYTGKEQITREDKASLTKNLKALFMHKVGEVIVFSTDNLVISYYINLTVVGVFNSYNMIISSISTMIYAGLNGITASIGNLLIEGEEDKIYQVHKKVFFFSFWLVSFALISLFNTLRQFVLLWLDDTQFLDTFTISLILLNFYFSLMRASVEKFKEAGGLHHQDRFAPIAEALINLIASLLLVRIMGLPGVFVGTLISNLLVVFWVKPLVVYKYIFKVKLKYYFIMYFKYFSLAIIPLLLSYFATRDLQGIITINAFLLNCLINIFIINIVYILIFRKNDEFLYFKNLFLGKLAGRKQA
ncbi:lipopolysaccharide biosynthesis protein [Planococcus salinarum]|uniref:lipopolysaccharide biosynthesis protein n=1 Tax=Planococcus salinarum TaxID=622695 RepID=UPI000E3D2197|nr:oligosaccharide flippase family protein [Planococcus salinarum]TAA72821.1 O-unit flippase [Planococcus salinarum]